MPRSKEILVLLVLLVAAMAFVLWYVIDRRAQNRAAPPVATRTLAPEPPVDLTKTDGKTVDFSSGRPVVKNEAADQAAIAAAMKDINEATQGVTFKVTPPPPAPAAAGPAPPAASRCPSCLTSAPPLPSPSPARSPQSNATTTSSASSRSPWSPASAAA
jgi:hypothetical protein